MDARSAVRIDAEGVAMVRIEDETLHGKLGLEFTKLSFFVILIFFHCSSYEIITVSDFRTTG